METRILHYMLQVVPVIENVQPHLLSVHGRDKELCIRVSTLELAPLFGLAPTACVHAA